jgi:hypothetical protein
MRPQVVGCWFYSALTSSTCFDLSLSVLVAFVLATLIGVERQYRQRSAGLRTNVLVAVGAAIRRLDADSRAHFIRFLVRHRMLTGGAFLDYILASSNDASVIARKAAVKALASLTSGTVRFATTGAAGPISEASRQSLRSVH